MHVPVLHDDEDGAQVAKEPGDEQEDVDAGEERKRQGWDAPRAEGALEELVPAVHVAHGHVGHRQPGEARVPALFEAVDEELELGRDGGSGGRLVDDGSIGGNEQVVGSAT